MPPWYEAGGQHFLFEASRVILRAQRFKVEACRVII